MKISALSRLGVLTALSFLFSPLAALAMPFSSATTYATGGGPWDVVMGDWNKDGKLDVATSNDGSDTISVFRNDGQGGMTSYLSDTTCLSAYGLTTADFNGDTWPDLAVACRGADRVTVFLNRADGTGNFLHGTESAGGSEPNNLVAYDFDLDGKMDLVAVSFAGGVNVLIGNGDGTFQAPVSYAAGLYSTDLVADDFDNNGRQDLVVTNSCAGCFIPYGTGSISFLSGNGDGTFAAPVNYPTVKGSDAMVAGDWDNDGNKDIALAKHDNGGAINKVGIMMGNGDGTFDPVVDYNTATRPQGIAAGDLNQDGKADLAVANTPADNFSVLTGVGDGTFNAYTTTTAGNSPVGIALGDLNNDGKLDLALVNYSDDTLGIYFDASPPVITSLSPNSATAGSGGRTITVTGSGFAANVKGRVNGSDRPTSNITPTSLTMGIGPSDVASNGTLNFTIYNPALALTSNSSGFTVTGQTSSGGGGGLPPEAFMPPAAPEGGFAVSLDNGASRTAARKIHVTFKADSGAREPKTKSFAISNTPDFVGASIMPLPASGMDWDVCAQSGGAILPATCASGEKTVYVKFYSTWGQPSAVFNSKIIYGTSAPMVSSASTASNTPKKYAFGRNLRQGSIGTDVRDLQRFLNAQGFTVSLSGPGSNGNETTTFGPATLEALKRFQTAHANQILKPFGLALSTGYFGPATRGFINSL